MGGRVILHRKINLFGKGESEIEAQAMDLTNRGRVPEVGITASDATISFRITAEAATEDEARRLIEPTAGLIYERFGGLIVGEDSDDVAEAVAAQLAAHRLDARHGGVVHRWSDRQDAHGHPGVSASYLGGVVTYANSAKTELLGVPVEMLKAHGAVSPEVAAAMAEGVRTRLGASVGISTTGVAGPAGGTPEKPVGLVYLGLSTAKGTQTRRLDMGPERPRDFIQLLASKAALNWARLTLLGEGVRVDQFSDGVPCLRSDWHEKRAIFVSSDGKRSDTATNPTWTSSKKKTPPTRPATLTAP